MQSTIMLDGGKEVKLAANAATPFRFKQLFGKDLLRLFNDSSKNESEMVDLADTITELAFIMNSQAEGRDMNRLSLDEFYSWLEDYEPMDFIVKSQEVVNVYLSSTQVSAESKKKTS